MDLFSGSGALGIEALSRGARHAVFVDSHPVCVRCIGENLERCDFPSRAQVLQARLPDDFRSVRKVLSGAVDIVLADPPYGWDGKAGILQELHRFSLVNEHATIVFEHFHKDVFSSVPQEFVLEDERRYGDTVLTFFHYQPGA
jgi:16S rRNA (guanine966-N2)-methyltransferase